MTNSPIIYHAPGQLTVWLKPGVKHLSPRRGETYLKSTHPLPVSMDTISWRQMKWESWTLAWTLHRCRLGSLYAMVRGVTVNYFALPLPFSQPPMHLVCPYSSFPHLTHPAGSCKVRLAQPLLSTRRTLVDRGWFALHMVFFSSDTER